MEPIAISRFHDHIFRRRRCGRAAQNRATGVAQISGKQNPALVPVFLQFEEYAGRAEDVAGIEISRVDSGCQDQRFSINGGAPEILEAVECIQHGIQGCVPGMLSMPMPARMVTRFFLLQMTRVQ